MSNEIFMVSTVRPWARPATFELEPMAKSATSMLFMAATETMRSVISKTWASRSPEKVPRAPQVLNKTNRREIEKRINYIMVKMWGARQITLDTLAFIETPH